MKNEIKTLLILVMIGGLVMIAVALTQTQFNDATSSGNLFFYIEGGIQKKTVSLPNDINITSAKINLTGFSQSLFNSSMSPGNRFKDLTWNGSHIHALRAVDGGGDANILIYLPNGTLVRDFEPQAISSDAYSLTYNGTNFFIGHDDAFLSIYTSNFTYTNTNITINALGHSRVQGLIWTEKIMWVMDSTERLYDVNLSTGNYKTQCATSGDIRNGMGFNNSLFYLAGKNFMRIINQSCDTIQDISLPDSGDLAGVVYMPTKDYFLFGHTGTTVFEAYKPNTFPLNFTLKINDTTIYENLSLINGITQVDLNITELQKQVDACENPSGNNCLIDLYFEVQRGAKIFFSDLIINYTINDTTLPIIRSVSLQRQPIMNKSATNIFTMFCEDTESFLNKMNFTLRYNQTVNNMTRFIDLIPEEPCPGYCSSSEGGGSITEDTKSYIWNYTLFAADETANEGFYNITNVGCTDRSSNYAFNDSSTGLVGFDFIMDAPAVINSINPTNASSASSSNVTFHVVVTEEHPSFMLLYHSINGSKLLNQTKKYIGDGVTENKFESIIVSDNTYNWSVSINTSFGTWTNSTQYVFTVDTSTPGGDGSSSPGGGGGGSTSDKRPDCNISVTSQRQTGFVTFLTEQDNFTFLPTQRIKRLEITNFESDLTVSPSYSFKDENVPLDIKGFVQAQLVLAQPVELNLVRSENITSDKEEIDTDLVISSPECKTVIFPFKIQQQTEFGGGTIWKGNIGATLSFLFGKLTNPIYKNYLIWHNLVLSFVLFGGVLFFNQSMTLKRKISLTTLSSVGFTTIVVIIFALT